jgi:hypothetical protein
MPDRDMKFRDIFRLRSRGRHFKFANIVQLRFKIAQFVRIFGQINAHIVIQR